jgi:hypothetical protein
MSVGAFRTFETFRIREETTESRFKKPAGIIIAAHK